MELKYRWMQKKDLDKMSEANKRDFINLINHRNTVANIVESGDNICGWMVYKVFKEEVRISKLGFLGNNVAEFMINNLKNKKGKRIIQVKVSEYDLNTQLILKSLGFLASGIKKIDQIDFYNFLFQ